MTDQIPQLLSKTLQVRGTGRQPEQASARTRRRSATALAGVPLFQGLSKRHLNRLAAAADEVSFGSGETLVQQGLTGEALFVMLEGEARVVRDGRTVANLLPGDFFGEVSLVDGGLRTASVLSHTPVVAIRAFRPPIDA